MGRRVWPVALAVFLAAVLLSPSVCAHEQEILNVILVEDEARPGNVSDSAFVEGNGLVSVSYTHLTLPTIYSV